jgi:hypothetical protein
MMVFEPINEEVYDKAATFIAYAKIFPHLLKDFITREDAKKMMDSQNLPVTTEVTVNPGQAVQVAVPAGTGSTTSPAKGTGQGRSLPIYNGSFASAGSKILEKKVKAKKELGGASIEGLTEGVSSATGI